MERQTKSILLYRSQQQTNNMGGSKVKPSENPLQQSLSWDPATRTSLISEFHLQVVLQPLTGGESPGH